MILHPDENDKEFIEYAKGKPAPRFKNNLSMYGLGRSIKQFYSIPSWLPIFFKSQHGVCLWSEIPSHELNSDKKVMLVFNRRWVKIWADIDTTKKVIACPHPYLLYKKTKNIKRSDTPTGSIFFYAHSTSKEKAISDDEAILNELLSLPEDFHPCTISMHYIDVINGKHRKFQDAGLDVFCAGNVYDPCFVDNFYNFISEKKYAISNFIGSHYFYCIEHGLPFTFIGDPPTLKNVNYKSGDWNKIEKAVEQIKENYKFEKVFRRDIKKEEESLIKDELGYDLYLSRTRLYFLIMICLIYEGGCFFRKIKNKLINFKKV